MAMIAATASRSNPVLANRVLARCQDATLLAFTFDHDTTLGQLAERLGTLANPHGGLFLPIQIRLAAGRQQEGARTERFDGTPIIPRCD